MAKGNSKGSSGGSKGSSGGSKGTKGSSQGTKGSSQGTKGPSKGGPGPIGGAGSYGMSQGQFSGSIGKDSTKGSGGDSKGLGNVGWGGGSKGPSFGGGSYSASTGFGKGDTGSSFGSFGGSGKGSGSGGGGSRDQDTSKSSMNFGSTSYSPTTQFGREAMGMAGPSGGLPTGALKQVASPLQKEYSILDDVKGFFTKLNPFADDPEEATAGYSPMGGWASYGGAIPGMEDTRGFFDKLGSSFQKFGWGLQDAPLATIADALSNPMMVGVGAITGTLPAMAAVRATSAVTDMVSGVSDMVTGAKELASTALSSTPLGGALGPLKGVASGLIKGPEEGARAIGSTVGGTVGSNVFGSLALSLTDNPYAGAIAATTGGVLSAVGLGNFAASQAGMPSKSQKVTAKAAGSEVDKAMSSPLVASKETSERLMEQGADPTKYIREMQLPFYGPSYTMNPYGFPNTMIGA